MPLTISDDTLQEAGLTERDALVEFACRLYGAEKLSLASASRLAGLDRVAFEDALLARKIPIYRPTIDDVKEDLAALNRLGV